MGVGEDEIVGVGGGGSGETAIDVLWDPLSTVTPRDRCECMYLHTKPGIIEV